MTTLYGGDMTQFHLCCFRQWLVVSSFPGFPYTYNHPALRDIFVQARNQIRICFDSIFLCTYGECVCLSFGNPACWDQSMIILTDFNRHFKWNAKTLCKKIRYKDKRPRELISKVAQRETVFSPKNYFLLKIRTRFVKINVLRPIKSQRLYLFYIGFVVYNHM